MKSVASQKIYKANGCVSHLPLIIPSLSNLSSLSYFLSALGCCYHMEILIRRLNITTRTFYPGGVHTPR
jgi:hypothetical protein